MVEIHDRDTTLKKTSRHKLQQYRLLMKNPGCDHIDLAQKKIPTDVCLDELRKIVRNQWTSGTDMRALACAIQTMFFSAGNTDDPLTDKVMSDLSERVNQWITKIKPLSSQGVGGDVFFATLLGDVDIIVKRPQFSNDAKTQEMMSSDLMREYFIGQTINRLRYETPLFMYTLGIFQCSREMKNGKLCTGKPKSTDPPYLVLENIQGESVHSLIKARKLPFRDWLVLYIQLLASLEYAQQKYEFTHYDLHTDNVMVRKLKKPITYSILNGMSTYTFENISDVPTIIDFGLSSIRVEDEHHGADESGYEHVNILRTMMPGHDMYKFWASSLAAYEQYDPKHAQNIYRVGELLLVPNSPYTDHRVALMEHFKLVANSRIGTLTPGMYFNILTSTYTKIMSKRLTISRRTVPFQLEVRPPPQEYNNIFCDYRKGAQAARDIVFKCGDYTANYLLLAYTAYSLSKNPATSELSETLFQEITTNRFSLAFNDREYLDKVDTVSVPPENEIISSAIAVTELGTVFSNKDRLEIVKRWIQLSKPFRELEAYLQMYYTILELNIAQVEVYKEWIDILKQSSVYKTFSKPNIYNMTVHANRISKSLISRTKSHNLFGDM